MAMVIALLAKDWGDPNIGFQVLFYPETDANFETPSYRELATWHFLTRKVMKWFWDNYLPEEEQWKRPSASPLRASISQLKGLPPALVITVSLTLRDEDEAYAHKLNEAGVALRQYNFSGATTISWCSKKYRHSYPQERNHARQ